MVDARSVGPQPVGETADGGVISLRIANAAGTAVGNWIKLTPYLNTYDQQRTDNFTNCLFDPTDDGNDEDDFFDPTDPDRRLGPTSTCFPEFSYVWQGSTEGAFGNSNTGPWIEGPGLAGNLGAGTWIEQKFDLSEYIGSRIRLRFLTTSLKTDSSTWEALFTLNPDPGDDGWWIDDIQITNTLLTAATLAVDTKANSGLPNLCSSNCTSATASVTTDPPSAILGAPGQVVTLDASGSILTPRCVSGSLQTRFTTGATVLRDWTDDAVLVHAPTATTTYTVAVRCSSAPACTNSTNKVVTVTCPTTTSVFFGEPGGALSNKSLRAPNRNSLTWVTPGDRLVFIRGNLTSTPPTPPNFTYTVTLGPSPVTTTTSIDISTHNPTGGNGHWYLVTYGNREQTSKACNALYKSGGPNESSRTALP
jgi:hypothetical protein